MTRFDPNLSQAEDLKGKVIVLTGGANGIGAATVELFHSKGANIVFGDWDATSGAKVAGKFEKERVHFLKTDVSKYEDNVALFRDALKSWGRVDHAMSIAGITEQRGLVDPKWTIEDVEKPFPMKVIDVNLNGPIYFTRIASAYLRHDAKPSESKSITLLSSVAGFIDAAGLPVYSAAKHGVMGLFRALRDPFRLNYSIRLNAICPSFVATALTSTVDAAWRENNMPVNEPMDIAKIILGLVAGKTADGKEPDGLAVFAEGGRGWEFQEGLDRLRPEWLGKQPHEMLKKADEVLGLGGDWGE